METLEPVETLIPETGNGRAVGSWAKLLDCVDEDATDGYGFRGEFVTRGGISWIIPGSLVLECAGFKSISDQRSPGKGKYMLLWEFTEDKEWRTILTSTKRGWALQFREAAIKYLEEDTQ